MKRQLLFFGILILSLNKCISQNLNIKFLEQLTTLPFNTIEDTMINGYGFKIKNENEENTLNFYKLKVNNFDDGIIIKIFKSIKIPINSLDISIGKNFELQKVKHDLLENNYLYLGENEYFLIYKKENIAFLINKKPNSAGANHILITHRD